MTLDDLAGMVKRGFGEMQSRFGGVEETLTDHGHSLNRIEKILDSTVKRVDDHEVRIEKLEGKVG